MTNKNCLFLPALAIALSGCSNTITPEADIKWVSPAGAPTLAFYDQGDNANFVTETTPTNVAAQLQKNEYDAVVFDSISGLKSVKAKNTNYVLAKLITGGNFYLVSIDKEEDAMPSEADKVVSFGQNLIPDKVYSRLCDDYWHITNNADYVNAVSDALAVLKSGKYSGGDVDYVFIAQPALFAALNDKSAATYGKIKVVKNIRAEWKAYSGQDAIPQAGVFVNKDALAAKPNKFKDFFTSIDERITKAINAPSSVKEIMDAYGDSNKQQSRFGFNSNVMQGVQKNNENGFGLVSKEESINVNTFLTSLGEATFEDKYFVDTYSKLH